MLLPGGLELDASVDVFVVFTIWEVALASNWTVLGDGGWSTALLKIVQLGFGKGGSSRIKSEIVLTEKCCLNTFIVGVTSSWDWIGSFNLILRDVSIFLNSVISVGISGRGCEVSVESVLLSVLWVGIWIQLEGSWEKKKCFLNVLAVLVSCSEVVIERVMLISFGSWSALGRYGLSVGLLVVSL